MDRNIFYDFENNKQYTTELLDGISSGVSLFVVSDELKFLHFNRAADKMFGYKKGDLFRLTQTNPLSIFHPDYVDRLSGEIIAAMRDGRLFNYNCQILCKDGSYKWINLSAELIQHKEGGVLCFYCVLTPIATPRDTILKDQHFLIAAGEETDRNILADLIELMGGTCDSVSNALDVIDLISTHPADYYDAVFIGSRLINMNGFELAKEIRQMNHPAAEKTSLLLLLSAEDLVNLPDPKEIGIDRLMEKPLTEKILYPILASLSASTKFGS